MACPTSPDERARTEDQLYRVLSEQRQRLVLQILRQHREVNLSQLAEMIAVQESEKPLAEITSQKVRRVLIDLYHSQIPILAEVDLLHYTDKQDKIVLSDRGEYAVDRLSVFLEPNEIEINMDYT